MTAGTADRFPGGPEGGAGSRPHVPTCRHCDMVDDYRLTRQAQLQHAEGLHRQDQDYRAVVFKDWLRHFQWETEPDTTNPHLEPPDTPDTDTPDTDTPDTGGGVDPLEAARHSVTALTLATIAGAEAGERTNAAHSENHADADAGLEVDEVADGVAGRWAS